jgi:hypothetical protein
MSHLQELTREDWRKKILFLNKYIDDIDKFAVLDRTLHPQSPIYSMSMNSSIASDRRKVALQAENSYYVNKINELQRELKTKTATLSSMEASYNTFTIERANFEQEKLSLKKMIELLNR